MLFTAVRRGLPRHCAPFPPWQRPALRPAGLAEPNWIPRPSAFEGPERCLQCSALAAASERPPQPSALVEPGQAPQPSELVAPAWNPKPSVPVEPRRTQQDGSAPEVLRSQEQGHPGFVPEPGRLTT